MANYRKAFNLRNGVQVDDDNFIVNANGLVGIGTSIPREFLDVRGNAQIVGLVTANTLYAGVGTIGNLNISQSLVSSGVITASSFSGSASGLTGIYAIAVDGWYVTAGTISTTSKVGIGTTLPTGQLQIGTGITFNSNGNATYSGIVTASQFNGSLNASNLTGTIDNSRLPSNINVSGIITASSINVSGIITASSVNVSGVITASSGFVGNLTGTASSASSIISSANVSVNSINSGFSTSGISTVHTKLHILGNIGVGTQEPNAQIHLRKSGISSIQITSDGSNSSIITFGRSVTLTTNNAQLRFGNTSPTYLYSTEQSLDIINYDTGNLNFYLNPGGSGTGSYNWFKPSLGLIMTLNGVTGNLGINSASPSSRLSVVGDAHVSGSTTVGNLNVTGSFTPTNLSVSGNSTFSGTVGISTNNPLTALQVGNNPAVSNGVGISSSGNITASGTISASQINSSNISATGIITATNGFSCGLGEFTFYVTGTELIITVPGVGSTTLTLS
jgi:hypothetical protein